MKRLFQSTSNVWTLFMQKEVKEEKGKHARYHFACKYSQKRMAVSTLHLRFV